MTQTATPQIGLQSKLYIQTVQGTAIAVSGGTVSGGTLIGQVKKITPPKPKWGTEDITVLATPNTGRIFIKTLVDMGEVKVDGLYASADAGQALLTTAFFAASNTAAGASFGFLIEEPINLAGGQTTAGDQVAFNALVTDWEIGEADIDKVIPFTATLKITGAITVTLGS